MALLDELRKLTQPYDEEDDFFDGSEESFQTAAQSASAAQTDFENAFSNSAGNRNPELEERAYAEQEAYDQRVAGRRRPFQGLQQNAQSANQGKKTGRKNVNVPGSDINVILFNPKSFDEAGEQKRTDVSRRPPRGDREKASGFHIRYHLRAQRQDHPCGCQSLFHHTGKRQSD